MKKFLLITSLVFSATAALALDAKTGGDEGPGAIAAPGDKNKAVVTEAKGAIKKAKVTFAEPKDGATVATKFKVKMNVEGMKIRPAGEAPDEVTTGHHHIIVDGAAIPAGQPIPTDATHIHFGKGQTETELALAPGAHTLTLQFADGAHRSYGPALSQTIKVTVK